VQISYGEASEDHPGAALIQPGRHRYRLISGRDMQIGWNRGNRHRQFIVPE